MILLNLERMIDYTRDLTTMMSWLQENLLVSSLSGHIQRNQTMQHFLIFLDDALKNLLKGARYLNNFKNYTVDENTKKTK